jgi:hypothetical protein
MDETTPLGLLLRGSGDAPDRPDASHIRHRLKLTSRAESAARVTARLDPDDPIARLRRADLTRTP